MCGWIDCAETSYAQKCHIANLLVFTVLFNDFPIYQNRSRRKNLLNLMEKLLHNVYIFLDNFGLIFRVIFGVKK